MNRIGDWTQTFTGNRFYPFDPRPEDISIEDIAHHLAMICRFGGACRAFYSVAQHSVFVSDECPTKDALWGLLHDAAEAYVGDMVRPIKRLASMDLYREAEDRILGMIAARFGLSWPMPESVRRADEVLLATEARDVMGGQCAGRWSLQYEPKAMIIHPWDPRVAEEVFLHRFKELTG